MTLPLNSEFKMSIGIGFDVSLSSSSPRSLNEARSPAQNQQAITPNQATADSNIQANQRINENNEAARVEALESRRDTQLERASNQAAANQANAVDRNNRESSLGQNIDVTV